MRTTIRWYALFALALTTLPIAPALAACECRCVNGQLQALCTNAAELPPICPPTMCPVDSPTVPKIQPPVVPPVGTERCEQRRVYDPLTGRYEWQTVCE